uniref:Uncharacterized protein n=1 Tax=viral metagenome TaxID=1070528 RepID=A0A6C0EEQ2_9ZZZZ
MFCKYKNIFGDLEKDIHAFRIYNIAIWDVLGTIIFAYLIYLYYFPNFNYIYTLLLVFLLGIFFHRIFCVRTTVDKLLFE